MSLKDNVDYVKSEISREEKFLEGTVKAERFFKKYKTLLIAASALIVVAFIAIGTSNYFKEENKKVINIAFNTLLKNPNDKDALAILEDKSSKLYNVALYIQSKKENKNLSIDLKYIKELSAYKTAINNKDLTSLNNVSMKNDFLLKEFAIFNKAIIQAENGKYKEAKTTLKLIPNTSSVNDLVKVLNHYLLTK